MKRNLLITLCFIFSLISTTFAQTEKEEYDFLTKDYAAQTAKGIVPELEGYYLEDLLELSDKTGKVKLLYKNDQESIVPVATQIHIYDGDRTFYICIPHEKSEETIFNKYSEDLQNIVKVSSNAQSIFSLVMVQYPIELQKYYDEIKALEKAYTMQNELEDKSSNVVLEEPAADIEEEVVRAPKENAIVIKKYPAGTKGKKTSKKVARGKAKQKIAGGLSRRKLAKKPVIYNATKKTGLVRLNVCVNARGKVIKATLNKDSSTTRDKVLIGEATKFAKQFKFNTSSLSRQCGYIIIDFK